LAEDSCADSEPSECPTAMISATVVATSFGVAVLEGMMAPAATSEWRERILSWHRRRVDALQCDAHAVLAGPKSALALH
jgi:hypothetical protein